jgi:hypothetical protein
MSSFPNDTSKCVGFLKEVAHEATDERIFYILNNIEKISDFLNPSLAACCFTETDSEIIHNTLLYIHLPNLLSRPEFKETDIYQPCLEMVEIGVTATQLKVLDDWVPKLKNEEHRSEILEAIVTTNSALEYGETRAFEEVQEKVAEQIEGLLKDSKHRRNVLCALAMHGTAQIQQDGVRGKPAQQPNGVPGKSWQDLLEKPADKKFLAEALYEFDQAGEIRSSIKNDYPNFSRNLEQQLAQRRRAYEEYRKKNQERRNTLRLRNS